MFQKGLSTSIFYFFKYIKILKHHHSSMHVEKSDKTCMGGKNAEMTKFGQFPVLLYVILQIREAQHGWVRL